MYFESLLKSQFRIWGHHTRSAASGRVSKGRGASARFVEQILQDGFEFELDFPKIHCIYRQAIAYSVAIYVLIMSFISQGF